MKTSKKTTSDRIDALQRLRKKAEHVLEDVSLEKADVQEIQQTFQELQIHQLELEMQNDELLNVTEELERQKSKFINLFELAPVGYLTLDKKGVITDINRTGLRLFGSVKHFLLGKPMANFIYADDLRHFYSFFQTILKDKLEHSCQLRLFRSGRRPFYAYLNGTSLSYEGTDETYYLTLTDITDKKESELKLEEALKRLDLAFDVSKTGIWEIETRSQKIQMDDNSCEIFGLNTLLGGVSYESFMSLIHQDDVENLDNALRVTLLKDKELNEEFRLRNKLSHVAARGKIVKDHNDNQRFIGTLTDITDRKQMEMETSELKEDYRKLMMKAALKAEENERQKISEVLHDSIGQMLYATKLNLEECKDTSASTSYERANGLLDTVIKSIRNLSFELAPSILRDFGIAITFEDMAKRLSNERLAIHTHIAIDKEPEFNFAQSIFRVAQELLNNGIKHAKASKITVDLTNEGSKYLLRVIDNGQGFRHDHLGQSSTGSGLSSIRNRLSIYKGKMDIKSAPEEGTHVFITLEQPN